MHRTIINNRSTDDLHDSGMYAVVVAKPNLPVNVRLRLGDFGLPNFNSKSLYSSVLDT